MTFGEAIEALKCGARVGRDHWENGNFIWLKSEATVSAEQCQDKTLKEIATENGGFLRALPTFCIRYAPGTILTGWIPSAADILATDWKYVFTNWYEKEEKEAEIDWDNLSEESKATSLEVEELQEKDFDFDYKTFVKKHSANLSGALGDVARTRDIMGVGTSEEEKAATREKIASTANSLSARIQHDVLNLINEGGLDTEKRSERLKELRDSYLLETEDESERQFIEEQFETFLDYVADL